MKDAFDVLKKAARSLATTQHKRPRSSRGEEECVSNKKTVTSSKQDVNVNVNVELLKTKMVNLKRDPLSFKLDLITCCFSNSEEEDGQITQLPFVFVCLAFELMSNEPKRSIITNIACNMLRIAISSSQQEEDLVAILRLLSYKIAPMTDGGSDQLGIGEHNIAKAIAETYGSTTDIIKRRSKDMGDLGLAAQTARSTQSKLFNFKPKPLSVSQVYHSFQEIAQISGNDSKGDKISILKQLLSASRECEPKYLIRLLLPKQGLRVGFCEATLLDALGRAAIFLEKDNPPSLEEGAAIVKQAFAVLPVYDRIVHALFSIGVRKLQKSYGPSVGIAMEPMLCKAIGSVHDAIKNFGNGPYICEYKYDGERAQIHFMEDGRVEIFSRNLECSTRKYPDVVDTLKRLKRSSVTSFIMDCEIVAFDRSNKKLATFQKLMTRGRKDVDIDDIKINVCIFAFDLLYLNSQSLIEEQLGVLLVLGTGLSEQLLDECHDRFAPKVITNPKLNYIYNADKVQPDVWFEPSEVWEVKAGGLTISPAYSAAMGLVHPTKGLSLRNPAVLRVRVDKVPELATTAEQVAEMYSQQ
ncbi:DNA ligase 1-like [Silene latifolia]|uniref:DNA ligase 1-like n=1 Tax=Silene latifolia TaxID=37657 RepID=UPI003D782AC1